MWVLTTGIYFVTSVTAIRNAVALKLFTDAEAIPAFKLGIVVTAYEKDECFLRSSEVNIVL